ncbi:MAG: twin-arginine translocase subunit TatC [Planctomycetia bacterium]|nr:twin-arginine translocase subunit TatC [Planctomycetia bacterium]
MARLRKDDDLFNQSSMSFGDHLNELRRCLIGSIYWLTAGFLIALIPLGPYPSLSTMTVSYIQRPLTKALEHYYVNQSEQKLKRHSKNLQEMGFPEEISVVPKQFKLVPKEFYLFPNDLKKIGQLSNITIDPRSERQAKRADSPLNDEVLYRQLSEVDNFGPFKSNLEKKENDSTANATETSEADNINIINIENDPNSESIDKNNYQGEPTLVIFWEKLSDDPRLRTKSLSTQEPFIIFVKAALFIGILIGCPGIFYNFWSFVGAGLYPNEKKYVFRFLPLSLGLFACGFCLAFFVVFEMVLTFLFKFNAGMNIDPDLRISEWLNFVLLLPVGFGLAFQLPLVMFVLERLRIFTIDMYLGSWRIAITVLAFLTMMLTPPDPWSMICMLIPMIGLYFGGIFLCWFFPLPKSEFDDYNADA